MAWKKTLVIVGLAAAIQPFAARAQSSVTIYGLFDIGLEAARTDSVRSTREISGGSYGSRIGFRGIEDLGGGWSAIFRLEGGFAGDSGVFAQGGIPFGRESTVGFAHRDWGTLTMGRIPTPFSLANAKLDAFNWMGGGGLISLTRSATAAVQLLPQVVNARADNAVNWASPNWQGFEVSALASAGEGSTGNSNARGVSGRYNAHAVDAVISIQRQYGGGPAGGKLESRLAGGSYDFKWAKIFLGYTDENNGCATCTGSLARAPGVAGLNSSRFTVLNLGTRIPLGSATAIAQVARLRDRSEYAVQPGNRDATWIAIGGEYALSRRTILYGALATISNRNGSRYALGSGGVQQPADFFSPADASARALVLGLRHLF
jgi:predicted porin